AQAWIQCEDGVLLAVCMSSAKSSLYLVCWVAAAGLSLGGQQSAPLSSVKRIYVEAFANKDGAEQLRADVIAQLRRSNIAIAHERSGADAILEGSGETWVKGYRSLNPRSGRSPSNGTPVYGGFLSVELKDSNGETLWSYLATPAGGSEDISKDL